MANEGHTSLQVLETRVRQLILAYHELETERDNLRLTLERRERALEEAQQAMAELERKYTNLKIAKMIEISDNDLKTAKSRLAKLVRDIDKCIALINV